MAVNHVVGKKHRDFQTAALSSILHRTVFGAGDRIERAADTACGDFLADQFAGHFRADTDQAQLADLFIDRHLFEQISHKYIFGRERCRRVLG